MSTRKFYLDTSYIRSIGKGIRTLPCLSDCFISVVTFIELLHDIRKSDRDYVQRRGYIKNAVELDIDVNWEMPELRIASGFDEFTVEERRVEYLKCIIKWVVESDTLEGFDAKLASVLLDFPLEYFEQYDSMFGMIYIPATENGNANIRDAFKREQQNLNSVLPKELLSSFPSFVHWFEGKFGFESSLYALCVNLARQIVDNPDGAFIERIGASYNKSIDVFIKAQNHSSTYDLLEMRKPARNDAIDLAHFLYLGPQTQLITRDEGMKGIASAIGISVSASPISE
jgi:hypothetical protein